MDRGKVKNTGSREVETFHYESEATASQTNGKIRTAAYCRVSTLAEEQELSFETQCTFYKDVITRDPNKVLVGIYGDQGFSGLHAGKRKEFQRLIADCEAGKVDFILVKSISRFSRNTVECIQYLDKLRNLGVGVYFEKEGLNSLDAQGQILLSIYASIAQNESCSISENIRWTRTHKAEMGDPMRCRCYGYRIVKQRGEPGRKWVIHEEEAKRIRLIFRLAYQGYAAVEILARLQEYEARHGSNDRWTDNRIWAVLRREAYRGDILTDKMVRLDYMKKRAVKNEGLVAQYYVEQHHEPIVDPAIYDEVQDYIRHGYLNGRNKLVRQAWLKEHPEVLERRERKGDADE